MKIIYSPHSQSGPPPGPSPSRKTEFSGKPDRTMALQKNPPNEVVAGLAILPILATVSYYLLPESWQAHRLCQFAPQIIAYVSFGIWAVCNADIIHKLGLQPTKISAGIRLGLLIGLLLGSFNTTLISTEPPLWDWTLNSFGMFLMPTFPSPSWCHGSFYSSPSRWK